MGMYLVVWACSGSASDHEAGSVGDCPRSLRRTGGHLAPDLSIGGYVALLYLILYLILLAQMIRLAAGMFQNLQNWLELVLQRASQPYWPYRVDETYSPSGRTCNGLA